MRTLERLQAVLEGGGVRFIPTDASGGPGVRQSGQFTDRWESSGRFVTASDQYSGHGVSEDARPTPIMTPLQMKLARTALGLGVRDLADAANVAPSTVQRFESRKGGMHSQTLERLQQVFEDGGVSFIPADGDGGPGVRLRPDSR